MLICKLRRLRLRGLSLVNNSGLFWQLLPLFILTFVFGIYSLVLAVKEDARYFNQLGKDCAKRSDYDNALGYFKKASEIDPSYVYPWLNAGVVYLNKQDYESAISYLEKALALNPRLPEIYAQLALAYQKKGDYSTAMEYSQKALTIKQDSPTSIYNLGFTFVLEGDRTAALKQYYILKSQKEFSLADKLLDKIKRKFMRLPK